MYNKFILNRGDRMLRALIKIGWFAAAFKLYTMLMTLLNEKFSDVINSINSLTLSIFFSILLLGIDLIDGKIDDPVEFIRNAILYLIGLSLLFQFGEIAIGLTLNI